MNLSSVPFLVAAILAFYPLCALAARRSNPEQAPRLTPLVILGVLLGLWGLVSSWASLTDLYDRETFLGWLPGLWLPLVPILIATTCYLLSPSLRESLKRTLNGTPTHWHVLFQGLRLVSAGAMYKAYLGAFPVHFAMYSGGPDFLFSLSAFWMASRVKQGNVSRTGLILWNAIGFAALGLTAPLLLQLGLPGPMQLFHEPPLSDVILEFPMALAPTFTGPLLMVLNALWIKHLFFDAEACPKIK